MEAVSDLCVPPVTASGPPDRSDNVQPDVTLGSAAEPLPYAQSEVLEPSIESKWSVPVLEQVTPRIKCFEICCGSAGLSAALSERNFDCVAIDCKRNRFHAKHAITNLDITESYAVELIKQALDQGVTELTFFSPPCGTATKAREVPIPRKLRRLLAHGKAPGPLRSDKYPWGIPHLAPHDRMKVDKANAVYRSVIELVMYARSKGIKCCIENPWSSYLWQLGPFKQLLTLGFFDVVFQNCMHGGERPKWTRLRTDMPELLQLNRVCPGESANHKHKPWGLAITTEGPVFATAEETQYARELCNNIANCTVESAKAAGFTNAGLNVNPDASTATVAQLARMTGAAQRSSTGKRPAPLVSEFREVIAVDATDVLKPNWKKVRTCAERGASGCERIMVGVLREPEEFIAEALKLRHPVDMELSVPAAIRNNIAWMAECGPTRVAKFRLEAIRDLAKLVHDNIAADTEALAYLSPAQRKVLDGKKLVTLGMLAERIKHRDKNIVKEATAGFRITGFQPHSSYFAERIEMPMITEEQLRAAARLNNVALINKTSHSGDAEMDRILWSMTEEEIAAGWLEGPFYNLRNVEKFIGPDFVLSRRFGLQQGAKVRAIDDFNESNVNLAFGYCDHLQFHDVDVVAAVLNRFMNSFGKKKPKAWAGVNSTLLGRTLDLAHAYKQWALHTDATWTAVVLIWDPVKRTPAFCPQNTVPFGACASVLHFNRLSRLGWEMLCKITRLVVLNFYDDYPMFEPAVTARLARKTAETFLELLGWSVALDEGKAFDFAECFVSLGVQFQLDRIGEGLAFVANKPQRTDQVCDTVRVMLDKGGLPSRERDSLRGKLQFLERHIFGRAGRLVMRSIDSWRRGEAGFLQLDDEGRILLEAVVVWLRNSAPRAIAPTDERPPLLIFTDGAEEEGENPVIACGGLMLDPLDGAREFFAEPIPTSLLDEWKAQGNVKVIAQIELLPVLVAKQLWRSRVKLRRVLLFIDNEVAKYACVSMFSESLHSRRILKAIIHEELSTQSWTWYSRVPSHSNPADAASRLKPAIMVTKFAAAQVKVVLPTSMLQL